MTQDPTPAGDPTPIAADMHAAGTPAQEAEGQPEDGKRRDRRPSGQSVMREIMASSGVFIFFAIVLALIIGAILVAAFNPRVHETASYLFARPTDFFFEVWQSFRGFFASLFRGAVFDYEATSVPRMVKPITESITNSVPLILAGLSVAVAFRAGLFNIGAQGQIIIGALVGGYVGIAWQLPPVLHLLVAVLGAALGGAIWGAIPGILKARAGANEVIVTIMLNSVALYLLSYFLKTKTYIGQGFAGKSEQITSSAAFPLILGSPFRLHYGILLALLAAGFVWWLLERSTLGFEIRAAGANPAAARTAGVSVNRTIIVTMIIAGALAGLAATGPVLGTERFVSNGVAASFGFDAITVALLGRSKPLGVVFAGLLFGALNAGAATMQAAAQIPVDIVQVSQAIIVLFIAAPPLVRWLLRLPGPERRTTPRSRVQKKEVAAA
ncbi:ABC transporter permease [Bowdeniella nasicola]|uniref:ABC transporter permease n=1 Tax=Bowdeniella nasicola TaxID=208480 RepID=A0A1Q5Q0E0_9ACTO|nr:ABC transporter permease [Bowdeniella nasicola]OKL53152.1 ABC transporter permease [Bowdeniella nasicola]